MRIVVAGICRNERELIADYVYSALIGADSVVVLDTGSTDGTYEILLDMAKTEPRLTVSRQEFQQINFAEFRNQLQGILASMTYDFVIHLDVDERLDSGWREKLENLRGRHRLLLIRNEPIGFKTQLMRVFSKHDGEWRNSVHEGFFSSNEEILKDPPVDSSISVTHYTKISGDKSALYQSLLINHPDAAYYQLLGIYERKDYDLFINQYEPHAYQLSDEFKHLLVRYAIVSHMNVSRTIPEMLVNQYLSIDDMNTRFMLARYFEKCGDMESSRLHFGEFEKHAAVGNNQISAYMPFAHDLDEVSSLRSKLVV